MKQFQGIEEMPDEQLVAQAQDGRADALSVLITRYTSLAVHKTLAFQKEGLETEDLAQEGMLGLLSAIRTYRPDRESKFRTYAEHCILNRIRSAVRTFHRNKNRPMVGYTPLDEVPEKKLISQRGDPQDLLIHQEEQQQRQQKITSLLSSFEQKALQLYVSGCSYQQMAERLSCTTKAVDNALQRVRRKLHMTD